MHRQPRIKRILSLHVHVHSRSFPCRKRSMHIVCIQYIDTAIGTSRIHAMSRGTDGQRGYTMRALVPWPFTGRIRTRAHDTVGRTKIPCVDHGMITTRTYQLTIRHVRQGCDAGGMRLRLPSGTSAWAMCTRQMQCRLSHAKVPHVDRTIAAPTCDDRPVAKGIPCQRTRTALMRIVGTYTNLM